MGGTGLARGVSRARGRGWPHPYRQPVTRTVVPGLAAGESPGSMNTEAQSLEWDVLGSRAPLRGPGMMVRLSEAGR